MPNNMGAPQMPAPHDIEEILPYVVPWWQYAVAAATVIILAAGVYLLWRWLKNRKKTEPVVRVDHWAELSEALQKLSPEHMLANAQAKEFYFQLSLILRTAIELATGIRATDMTYRELAPLMEKKLRVKTEDLKSMQEFLKIADLVKFADRPATTGEAIHFKQELMLWVAMLKPKMEASLPSDSLSGAASASSLAMPSEKAAAKGLQA